MQRLPVTVEHQGHELIDYGLKPLNHIKKLESTRIENKSELSNISKDRQTFSALLKEEIKFTVAGYLHELEEDLRAVKNVVQTERRNGQVLTQQIITLKAAFGKNTENSSTKHSVQLKRSPSTQSNSPSDIKILHLQSQINLLSGRLDDLNEINRSNKLEVQKQALPIEISSLRNELKLQIAHLRDGFADIEQLFKSKHDKLELGNNDLLNHFQEGIDDLTQKYKHLSQLCQKNTTDLEKWSGELETNSSRIQKVEKVFKDIDNEMNGKMEDCRKIFEGRLLQAEEFFQANMEKIIVPYNSNFEDMDRSIAQLKEILKDVLKFTKSLGDKLVVKLSNTIDAATFQKTIQNMNQNFSQTYLLNTQKIKELNQKQHEVYNELNQVKDVLENLKVEYKSANKLSQDRKSPFEKKITSLGDLGIDSDSDDRQAKEEQEEETQETYLPNPFKRKTERSLQQSFN